MRELATKIIKKVSLEIIYDAVEERTEEIKSGMEELKRRQEEDFRYLNKRIDDLGGRIDTVIQMLMDMNRQMLELSKQK
jgi:hypothetical protein